MSDSESQFPLLSLQNMAYAYGQPTSHATFKELAEDFQVNEELSFDLQGDGTHAYLYIQKTDTNTQWLAKQLAKFAGIPERDVGYAGLKDRHAVTRQWFSVNLEGIKPPNWSEFALEGVKILQISAHRRKLKIGAIDHNEFVILLKNITDEARTGIDKRLHDIQAYGVPNYFGGQRFGHDDNNLHKAKAWFSGAKKVKRRDEKGIYLSAARSMLFNYVLSERIKINAWNQLMDGEVMMLDGSRAIFKSEKNDPQLLSRFDAHDIHPTASLWGKGELASAESVRELEQKIPEHFSSWCQALQNKGLKQERRAIRLIPKNFKYEHLANNQLLLQFNLNTGSYATALLRELVNFS